MSNPFCNGGYRPTVIFGSGCIKSVPCIERKNGIKRHCPHITEEVTAGEGVKITHKCCHCGHTEQYQAVVLPISAEHGEHQPQAWVFPNVQVLF